MPFDRLTRRLAQLLVLGSLLTCAGCDTTRGVASDNRPDEEIWSIRCITLHTPDRFQQADSYAAALKKINTLKPELVQVLSDDDGTAVFYGRYRREYGPTGPADRFTPDNLHDLTTIRNLTMHVVDRDVWPFILASMDLLPTYRSQHPEWDLSRATGYWSLQVGAFFNTNEFHSRRSAAEQYCAMLRDAGAEAYFYHGTMSSVVCVGVYPYDAVVEMRQEQALRGEVRVVSKIVDPKMQEAQQRYPTNMENGATVYEVTRDASGQVTQRVPVPSFPVILPKALKPVEKPKTKPR